MPNSGRPLNEVLDELAQRADGLIDSQRRLDGLLDTVITLGSDLSLPDVLSRVVNAACELSGARYGALGVIGPHEGLGELITVGMTGDEVEALGAFPRGAGVLGVLLEDPRPLRLDDLGTHPASVGFPAHHPAMRSFLGVPIRVRSEVFGNLYLTEKVGGGPFNQEDESIIVALASAAGVAVQNARLFGQAQQEQQWRSVTAEISSALAWDTDEVGALALVTDGAVACSGADGGALLLLSHAEHGADGILTVAGVSGMAPRTDVLESTPQTGQLFQAVGDAQPRHLVQADGLPSWLAPPAGGATMLLPLGGGRSPCLGLLGLRFPNAYVPDTDFELAASFAVQAAVALALGRARRDHERLALLQDRERIAQDLHDVVIQRLFATGLMLQTVSGASNNAGAEHGDPAIDRAIDRATDEIDASIRDLRRAIWSLRPDVHTSGLRAAITEQVRVASGGLGFEPCLRFDGPLDLAVNTELAADLQVVIREALANVMRHAKATKVSVALRIEDGAVVCCICDDGTGLPVTVPGNGTVNLRARAVRRAGTFRVLSRPGEGTTVTWSAPLLSPEPAPDP